MQISEGTYAAGLNGFEKILTVWLELQKRYLRANDNGDAAWIYTERASLSILAGATWCAGFTALEEFSTEKKRKTESAKKPTISSSQGRCDLSIDIGKTHYIAEAKQSWPKLGGRGGDTKRHIETQLKKAKDDVRCTSTFAGAHKLAVVLMSPSIPRNSLKGRDNLITSFLVNLKECVGGKGACAWFFPPNGFAYETKGRQYPGAAILIQRLKKK